MTRLLLDTCVLIWLGNGGTMPSSVEEIIRLSSQAGAAYVSPVSAWEIGLLSPPGRSGSGRVQFLPDPHAWFARVADRTRFKEAPLTTRIAIEASHLPGTFHNDPGDRLLVATAREMKLAVVTRDGLILDYARQGWVEAVEC